MPQGLGPLRVALQGGEEARGFFAPPDADAVPGAGRGGGEEARRAAWGAGASFSAPASFGVAAVAVRSTAEKTPGAKCGGAAPAAAAPAPPSALHAKGTRSFSSSISRFEAAATGGSGQAALLRRTVVFQPVPPPPPPPPPPAPAADAG